MSQHKHATVSSWQRDHDGTYTAEINGYALKVIWQPEGNARGFRWEGTSPDGKTIGNRESHEEIELAMAEAEAATETDDDGSEEAA